MEMGDQEGIAMVTEWPAGVQAVSGSALLKSEWSVPIFSYETFFYAFANLCIVDFIVKNMCSCANSCFGFLGQIYIE